MGNWKFDRKLNIQLKKHTKSRESYKHYTSSLYCYNKFKADMKSDINQGIDRCSFSMMCSYRQLENMSCTVKNRVCKFN